MTVELGKTGTLAKVTAIGEDGLIHFDRRDGKSGSFRATGKEYSVGNVLLMTEEAGENQVTITVRNLSTTLRHCRLRFTEQSLLFWMSRVG